LRHRIWLAVAGGFGFWLPVVLLGVLSRSGNFSIIAANTLPLGSVACVYLIFRRRYTVRRRLLSLSLLAGIYAFGPLAIWLTWTSSGGGFGSFKGPHDILWLLLFTVLPPFTLYLSTWNGTLVALLVVSSALVGIAMIHDSGSLGSHDGTQGLLSG